MAAFEEVVAAYEAEYPLYKQLAEFASAELQAAVRAAGLYTMPVTGRAKEPRSFGMKACVGREYERPMEEIKDKAGVRIIVFYERDIDRAVDVVTSTFECLAIERKLEALDYDQNGYLGTHLEVRLADKQVAVEGRGDLAGRPFEVQVRTMAQSAWAEVSHAQLYKPPAEVPNSLKRRIYRLVALVELIDGEVEAFRQEAEQTEGYREATAVAGMAERLATLGSSRSPDRLLSLELCAVVVPLYGAPLGEVAEIVERFADENEAGLRNLITEAEAAEDKHLNPLLVQPELPMLCERLEQDRLHLERAWPVGVPVNWLEDLAERWGVGRSPA